MAAMLVYYLPGSTVASALAAIILAFATLAALVAGLLQFRPRHRAAWLVLVVGQAASFGSWVLWERAILDGAPLTPGSIEDVFWIGQSVCLTTALVFLLASQTRAKAALFDAGILASALALGAWIFVLAPHIGESTPRAAAVAITYTVLDAVMLGLLARIVLVRRPSPAGALLLAGAGALLVTDVLYNWLAFAGAYAPNAWADLGWLVLPTLLGAAALHPTMATLFDPRPGRPERLGPSYLLLLGVAAFAMPALAALELVTEREVESGATLVFVTALALLLVVRLVMLVRGSEGLARELAGRNRRLHDRTVALELLQKIANAANESASSDEALTRAIREICTATGWPVGHVFVREPGFPQLAPRPLWHLDDPDRWAEFVQLSDALHFVSGHGLPGLVLERGRPVWLEAGMDGDAIFPRAALARELGIRSFFAFPIWVGDEIAAVLEFFSTEKVDPDGGLTELAGPIGVQLARVLERERAGAAVLASESRFRGLVENVPGAIYRIACEDSVRSVDYLSDDILDIVGYTGADFVAGRIAAQDVIHPDDLAAVDGAMTRAAEHHSRFSLEYRMIHRDGGVRWVSESGQAVHDEATGSTWFDGSIVDVTARKQGEEALAHLAAIVESSQDAILGTTLDGTILSFNRAAERLYGYTAAETVGTSMGATVPPDRLHERDELLGRAARAEVVENFETVRIRKDGTVVVVSLTVSPVHNADGAIAGASVIARDITAAKDSERKLREAEDRFRTLAEQLPLTTYIDAADASGNSYVSPQIETMSGYPAADWLDNPGHFATLLHPDDRERVLAAIAEAAEAGAALSQEYRMIARDGRTVWLRDSAVTIPDAEGRPAYRQGYAIDVTAEKEAEALLRETEAKYRALVEQLPVVTYVEEPGESGATIYVSPRIEQLLGYTAEEWVADPELFFNILHPDDEEWVRAEHVVAYREHTPLALEYRLIHRDGRTVWIQDEMLTRRDEDGSPLYAQGYFLDITERKAADERLRDAEIHYRTLVEQLPVAVYTHALDDTGTTTYMSARIEAMLGYAPDEWLADRELFGRLVYSEDRESVMAQVAGIARTGEPFSAEYRMVARNGRVIWIRDEGATVRAEDGTALYAQGYMLDITERKQSEERLRDSEERTRLLFDTALDAIVTMDAEGTVTGWNAQAEATFGWSAGEAIGRRLSETAIPHEDGAGHQRGLERFLATGEGHVLSQRIEVAAQHRNGREFPVELAITPLSRSGGFGFSAFLRDISARKEAEAERDRLLEAERAQTDRLRELDRLKDEFIALVSHELRTPLTSIRGYLELVTDGASGELTADQEQFLGVVARNAERLQSLVGDLLFVAQIESGGLSLERGDVDLAAVAAESVESGRPLAAPKQIELSLVADTPVGVDGDRGRLGQLLDNFVSNAIKFTPAGGRVEIRVTEEHGTAVIEVADNGMGIPENEQERLFERFFRSSNATAEEIQGTGLGLTISKAIVEAHGGRISFTSVENQGTTFRIELPLATALEEAA